MLHLYPARHLHHTGGGRPAIVVGLTEERQPHLTIEAGPGETFDDADLVRYLNPKECRALAAMLWHVAEEAERR